MAPFLHCACRSALACMVPSWKMWLYHTLSLNLPAIRCNHAAQYYRNNVAITTLLHPVSNNFYFWPCRSLFEKHAPVVLRLFASGTSLCATLQLFLHIQVSTYINWQINDFVRWVTDNFVLHFPKKASWNNTKYKIPNEKTLAPFYNKSKKKGNSG